MAEERSKPYMSSNDYLVENEITVQITLSEYRDLVAFKAKHDAEMAELRTEKFNIEQENKRLKNKILSLTTECKDDGKEEEEW